MTRPAWIVCERTSRWAAAVRAALRREFAAEPRPRLREVRRLAELDAELAARRTSLVALEVRPDNLAELLAWLADNQRSPRPALAVVLLDRGLSVPAARRGRTAAASVVRDVGAALREAGACEVVPSPRQLAPLLSLARGQAAALESAPPALDSAAPFLPQLWARLPWQRG